MTRYIAGDGVYKAEGVNVLLTAANTSPTFTGSLHTFVWYASAVITGTLECSLDNGATWFTVGTSVAKGNCSVITGSVFAGYEALAARKNCFRVSFASPYTGRFVVVGVNV